MNDKTHDHQDIEYKIIAGSSVDLQKLLNQWRHEYHLNILHMALDENAIFILLTRTRKNRGKGDIK